MKVFEKKYSDETLLDLESDLYESMRRMNLPQDEDGFHKGSFIIRVDWIPDDTEEN
jgi:hypothetical protein